MSVSMVIKRIIRKILGERRKDDRSEIVIPVDFSTKDGPLHLFLKTSNISRGGAFIETSKPLDEGSELELAFVLPTSDDPFAPPRKISCRAVIVHAYEDSKGKRRGIGVKFLDLSDSDWQKIEEFIKTMEEKRRTASISLAKLPDVRDMPLSAEKAEEMKEAQKEALKELEEFSSENQKE